MALLSDVDFQTMLGDDFKRKLSLGFQAGTASAEEVRADRASRLQKLSDTRFSLGALAFTGLALVLGAYYSGAGLGSVQAGVGFGGILLGLVGFGIFSARHRTASAEVHAPSP